MAPDDTDPARPDVSIAIVHYNTPDLLLKCLSALRASHGMERFEVFVVDNASSAFDPLACEAVLPGVQTMINRENLGFAVASNQALSIARGRYLLLLNPDAFVAPESISLMYRYLEEHAEVGCVTCRVELESGGLDLACRRRFPTPARAFFRMTLLSRMFPRSRLFGQYNLTYLDEFETTEIDQPCGAFMLVRSDIRESVGLLDERYFLFGEDTDWAYRIKRAGWKIMYVPTTTVRHVKRASSRQNRPFAIRQFYRSMRLFYREHYSPVYPRWLNGTILLATHLRERAELTGEWLARLVIDARSRRDGMRPPAPGAEGAGRKDSSGSAGHR